jgi:predicted RND superfamily exporter protein
VRTTGGAVALCSLTTILGYASLLIARNQALFSFGVLAVLGEVACLAAALLALPAVLRWRELARLGANDRRGLDVESSGS